MMKTRTRFVPIVMLVALFLVADSIAQNPASDSLGSLELLDRGSTGALVPKGPATMATLAVGAAGPGVATVGVVATPTLLTGAFIGNFYTAPGDFPSSWFPFAVTGAFAYHFGVPAPPGDIIIGAGVAPGPFPGGMGTMWAAFATAMFPLPPFMTPAVVGMPGLFPATPPALPVMTGQGVARGLHSPPGGPILGGLAVTMGPRRLHEFNGPPLGGDVFVAHPYSALLHFVAGCFVSGSTVPVELQSFTIE